MSGSDLMKVEVTKIGGRFALLIPDEVAREVSLREGERLPVTCLPNASLRIGPDQSVRDRGLRIARRAMQRYAETFKALAKG
jgi:antitoxin component of MazEF toxin-antitoxin module